MRRLLVSCLLLASLLLMLTGCASHRKDTIAGAPNVSGRRKLNPGELPGDKTIKNPEVAYNLALEFAGQRNMEAAHHYIDLAIKLQPQAKYTYAKGLFYLSEKHFKEAIGMFDQALKQGPGTQDNRLAILNAEGVCYMELEQDQKALDLFRQVVNAPGAFSRFESYYNMGVIYLREKKYLDAEAVFNKVIDENPNFYRAYNKLGILQGMKGRWSDAAISFKKALDLISMDYSAQQTDGAEIYCNYGEALLHEKLYPQAKDALLKVLGIAPEGFWGQKAKSLLAQMGFTG